MKVQFEEEFPCGYRYKGNWMTGLFDWAAYKGEISSKNAREHGCPLHGKDCKRIYR